MPSGCSKIDYKQLFWKKANNNNRNNYGLLRWLWKRYLSDACQPEFSSRIDMVEGENRLQQAVL